MHESWQLSQISGGPSPSVMSPTSLQLLCQEVICDRLDDICVSVSSRNTDTSHPDGYPSLSTIMKFPTSEVYFHSLIAEKLLSQLGEQDKKLTDKVMTLFESRVTNLRNVRIKDASQLTAIGLKILKGHKILELEVIGLRNATVTDLITCLNDWSVQNLRFLNVTNSTFVDANKYMIVVALSKLRNLQVLNVSGTEFNKTSLEMVVDDLPLLENIDISQTKVNDISSLRKCRHRLKSLSLHGLIFPTMPSDAVLDILSQLTELRHLDVSEVNMGTFQLFDMSSGKLKAKDLLRRTDILPNLVSLDISGKDDIELATLVEFIDFHPNLKFLGLVFTEVCKDEVFVNPDVPEYVQNIIVAGSGNEAQTIEALRRYPLRPHFVQNSLYNLFRLTQCLTEPRLDLIELVVSAAKLHKTDFNVQMAATACLYNLSKGEIGDQLHPSILAKIVTVDLDAMEQFPQHQQLQKNVLLTICSDRILQDVNFDRFRCARLVMDCLYTWQNHSMNRMSVAICSILAAKITTKETSQLGSSPNYMQKLLKLVRRRVDDANIDITLKFTLSALWNLTDESPKTCSVFLEEGGLHLYMLVLQAFPEDTPVQTKVLGLLNNIAEVEQLRSYLMVDGLISILNKLLFSTHIDVSYFAAGIVAHLASDIHLPWSIECTRKKDIMRDLFHVVSNWQAPKEEMVAYRSFKPFFQLMAVNQESAVQLWAIWAISQVCSKNPQRYCSMLEGEGAEIIERLQSATSTVPEVAQLCEEVLTVLGTHRRISQA